MTPYFESKSVTIYHGDCLEVLPTLGAVDAVVTDPPYGVGWDCDYASQFPSRFGKNKTYRPIVGDAAPFDPSPWLSFPRVAMFGYNCFSNRLPIGSLLVWNKRRDSMLGRWMSDAEICWINRGHGVYLLQHEWHGALKASERGCKREHPTQKPVVVMEWVMDRLRVAPGATVLDPFLGSGTTAVACVKTGRKCIGIELDEGYCEVAARRVQEAESHVFAEAAQ